MLETRRGCRRRASTFSTGFNSLANSSTGLAAVPLRLYAIVATLITVLNYGALAGEMQINVNNWGPAPKRFNQATYTRAIFLQINADAHEQQPLAVKHDRIDPLDHFKKYKGGYDLQGKHYLASTLYTGVHGYLIGGIWLLGGISGAIAFCIRHRKRALKNQLFSKLFICKSGSKLVPMLLATLLTTLIIACCGVIFLGDQRFHTTAKRVERTIMEEGADNATRLIYKVTQLMGQMSVDIGPFDKGVSKRLDNATTELNNASINFLGTVQDHKSNLDSALTTLNIGVTTIAASNIALWALGLACLGLFPKLRRWFLLIFALAWFIVFIDWVAFGVTFAVSNFADDTCEALKEYQESSRNTTLDSVLPCNDLASGSKTVLQLRQKIHNYIEEANKSITKLYTKLKNQEAEAVEKVVPIPQVCNPFSGPPTYTARNNCMEGTISIYSLPQLLFTLKCPNTSATMNTSSLPCIPLRQYSTASAYVAATEKFMSLLPEMENLTECSFVVDTFTTILQEQCKPLKHSIIMVWIAMVVLSALTTFTMFLWLLQFFLVGKNFRLLRCGGTILPHDHPTLSP